jgi:hypothetical protein
VRGTLWVEDAGMVTRAEMHDPTAQALGEIANPKRHQRDVAQTVALVLEWGQRDQLDWEAVAAAATARWGRPGWTRIKRMAWTGKCWPEDDR